MNVLSTRYGDLRDELARAFASALGENPPRWGGGVSVTTMERLRAGGLQRLWIELGDGWEGGLWHPEAVAAGVAAGYLVAPYDSYETALVAGTQDRPGRMVRTETAGAATRQVNVCDPRPPPATASTDA